MESPTKLAPKRLLELDVLRFVAVFLVLGSHMATCPPETSALAAFVSELWHQGGWIGVDIFFVLSGFLVSGLLFREYEKYSSIDMKRFLIRRGFKIYPAFWAFIGVTLVFSWLTNFEIQIGQLCSELLFVQNYFKGIWAHTWSLAVEEHFYLLLAAIVVVLVRRRKPGADPLGAIPVLFFAIAISCIAFRILTHYFNPDAAFRTQFYPTHLRIDSLMFGVLLSYSWHRNGLVHSKWVRDGASALIGLGILMLVPAFLFKLGVTPWIMIYGFVLFYVGSGVILIGLLHRGVPGNRAVVAISTLGAYSYSIYLWHIPVRDWLVPSLVKFLPSPLNDNWFVFSGLYLASSFLVGVLMGRLVEGPALALRDRMYPRRSQSLTDQDTKEQINESRSRAVGWSLVQRNS